MFQLDSIKHIISSDTSKAIKSTASRKDTILSHSVETVQRTAAKVDTITSHPTRTAPSSVSSENIISNSPTLHGSLIQNTDTLPIDSLISNSTKTVADTTSIQPTGFIGEALPTAISNSIGVFMLFFFLTLLLSIALKLKKEHIIKSVKSFFVRNTETSDSFKLAELIKPENYFIITLFTIGVWAFALEILFNPFIEPFSIKTFLYRAVLLSIFILAKHIIFEIVGRTFFGKNSMKRFKSDYFNIFFYSSILLFPILICYVYIPEIRYLQIQWVLIGTLGIAYTSLLFKTLQTFYSKILDLFYIFLYFCTLEILPLAVLIGANKLTNLY